MYIETTDVTGELQGALSQFTIWDLTFMEFLLCTRYSAMHLIYKLLSILMTTQKVSIINSILLIKKVKFKEVKVCIQGESDK